MSDVSLNQATKINSSYQLGLQVANIATYLEMLFEYKWTILATTLIASAIAVAYTTTTPPTYQANILVQVEDGSNSSRNILGDLSSAFDVKSATSAEVEILRSRMVINRAVENAGIDLNVEPKYFPIAGRAIARYNDKVSAPGIFHIGGYVWGKEFARVNLFEVPTRFENEVFTLTVLSKGVYSLENTDLNISFKAEIGDLAVLNTPVGQLKILVEEIVAQPNAQFLIRRFKKADLVEELQRKLVIAEKGKQSGVLDISLEGLDPSLTVSILNEIGKEYIKQNVERKSAEAEKSLDFLEQQLPKMKADLEHAESKYNALRNSRGTINLEEEARSILQQSVISQTQLITLKQKRDELLTRYQVGNPLIEAVNRQIDTVRAEIDAVNLKIRSMPSVEQDVLRLTRDVKVGTELYTSLLNSAQQLRLLKASKVGNARVLDEAVVPLRPIRPKKPLVILLGLAIGLISGVLYAITRKSLLGGVEEAFEIEQALGQNVAATIPLSPRQRVLSADISDKSNKVSVLAVDDPTDVAIESIRSMRTTAQFSLIGAEQKIIMITGTTPGVGKSFVSANFAAVLASTDKKVLLIDADLRKGYLNQHFGLPRGSGLSELIAEAINLDAAVHANVIPGLDLLPSGNVPPNPSELLGHPNFVKLLGMLAREYDYIVIDTPPVLAVTDAIIIAPYAKVIFNVARSNVTTLGEIEETNKRIQRGGASITGVILNGLNPRFVGFGRYSQYKYVQYKY